MQEGLLWFDADAKIAPQAKLAEAAARFAERFGRPANCCHVHPDELFAAPNGFAIVPNPAVLRHHFWVGRDEALAAAAGSARRQRPRKRSA
jgi:hypothetical protein